MPKKPLMGVLGPESEDVGTYGARVVVPRWRISMGVRMRRVDWSRVGDEDEAEVVLEVDGGAQGAEAWIGELNRRVDSVEVRDAVHDAELDDVVRVRFEVPREGEVLKAVVGEAAAVGPVAEAAAGGEVDGGCRVGDAFLGGVTAGPKVGEYKIKFPVRESFEPAGNVTIGWRDKGTVRYGLNSGKRKGDVG